jgi:hypothetical protein
MSLAKKLKMIVKGERKPTFGTDPNEPWSVRAGITEAEASMLGSYLKSRGINPEFVSKDTKISHAKSTEFSKWKRDHMFDDPADTVSSVAREKMKSQREEVEIEEGKTLQHTPVELRQHALDKEKHMTKVLHHNGLNKEEVKEAKTIQGTALDKFRQAAAERARKHDDIERAMKARHAAGKEDMKGSIDRLEKQLNKEAIDTKDLISKLQKDLPKVNDTKNKDAKPVNWTGPKKDDYGYTDYQGHGMSTDKQERQASKKIKEESGVSKSAETKFHKKLDKLVHSTFGKRKDEMKMKEEVDITEKNDSHTHAAHYEDPKTGEWTGMNLLIAKDDDDAIRQANEKCKEGCRLTKVERHITVKEETEHKVGDSVTVNSKFFGKQKGKVTKVDNQSIHVQRNDKKTSEKYPHDAVVKEEFEQIDEISKSTLSSYKDKSSASMKNAQANRDAAEPGKNMSKGFADLHAKSDAIVKKRVKGLIGYMQRKQGMKPMGEDVYQDSQAATQTAFDMGTTPNQTEPTYSRKKEMSKSARIIKSLYKHNNMKEDIYDHEKEDKSVATYGKKPKVEIVGIDGDEDNQAAMVLKGGRTLTGQERDTLEIDPVMRKPTNPEIKNSNKKTDK